MNSDGNNRNKRYDRLHAPEPLRDLPLWCVWAYEQYEGEPKPRKIPQYSLGGRRSGKQGTPEDLAKLTTFSVARDAAARRGLDGVGFALSKDAGVVALDFDHCIVDGKVDPTVLDLVSGTYAEKSPSGTGVRAFFTGAPDVLGNKKSRVDSSGFATEVFSSTGFVTVTGCMLDHVELVGLEDRVAPLPQKVVDFCRARFGASERSLGDVPDFTWGYEPRLGLSVDEMESLLDVLDPDMGRDDWVRVGMALHHECEGDDTGFDIWNDWSANGGKYPGEEALREQWDSFTRRMGPGRRQVTMASVIHMTKQADLRLTPSAEQIMARVDEIAGTAPSGGRGTPEDFEGKFPVLTMEQATQQPRPQWFIKGILPDADLAVLFGASGAGKSFVAFDMAAALARGIDWRGYRTRKAKVLMVVAEGSGGFAKRVKAYCRQHCIEVSALENLRAIYGAPNILDTKDVAQIVASVRVADADIVIWDTFAQVTPGANENAGEDMGRALANLRTLRSATGAMNFVVHHAGKDLSRGSRGWSGLKAAADAELEVSRSEQSDFREIRISKMKDGEDNLRWGFKLDTIVLGTDEDADPETSCVVMDAELRQPGPKKGVTLGVIQQNVLDAAKSCGAGSDGAAMEEVIDLAINGIPHDPKLRAGAKPPRDQRRNHVTRALKVLCDRGILRAQENRLYIA